MAYQRPLVMVFQEYDRMGVSGGDTKLSPCIVGPCYHIVDIDDDRVLSFAGRYQDLPDSSSVPMPNQQVGAELDKESVKVRIEEPTVQVTSSPLTYENITDNVVTVVTIDDNHIFSTESQRDTYFESNTEELEDELYVTVDGTLFQYELSNTSWSEVSPSPFNKDVTAGDTILVTVDSEEVLTAKVLSVSPEKCTYTLTRSVPDPVTTGSIDVLREIEDHEFTVNSEEISADDTIDISEVTSSGYSLISGEVFIGYRALRKDLFKVDSAGSPTVAEGILGKLNTHKNPLGLGVALTLTNTTTDVKFIGITEDSTTGYAEAQGLLENTSGVYGIVPLTQDIAVTSAFGIHASQMSTPEKGMWRAAIISSKMPEEVLREEGKGLPKEDMSNNLVVWRDVDANFLSNGVGTGDQLVITDDEGKDHSYTISNVISEDMLAVDSEEPFDITNFDKESEAPYPYKVLAKLTKLTQAEEISNVSKSLSNRKVVHVWPDICGIGEQDLPGYYLACTVAGATGGLPPHQGFTRLSIGGISYIKNSNDYFNMEQLDEIADGGTFIFTQENPNSAPVIRHQLTTDMSTIEFREFSFVKNFDYVSIICKETLDRFLGQYNITPATLAVLDTAMRAVLESMKLNSLPKIGSPVLDFDVTNIYQLDSERDRVEMYVDLLFPYALNKIGLHLVSQ